MSNEQDQEQSDRRILQKSQIGETPEEDPRAQATETRTAEAEREESGDE